MKDTHKDCLRQTLFIYICAANCLEISMLLTNYTDESCRIYLSSVSMTMLSYFVGFFLPAVGCFIFLLLVSWFDCLTGLTFNYSIIIRMMFASMLWRFIWVAVGMLILFVDLIPKNQCQGAIMIMKIDFFSFYSVLFIMLLVVVIYNIISYKRKDRNQGEIQNQSQTKMDEISKNIDFSI